MTLISKGAGVLSIISNVRDIHETAKIYAQKGWNKATYNSYISNSIASQLGDRISVKDAQRRKWVTDHNIFRPIKSFLGQTGGYFKGLGEGIARYIPHLTLSAFAIGLKNSKAANICAAALGVLEGYDFIKHSTGIGKKTDYLNMR